MKSLEVLENLEIVTNDPKTLEESRQKEKSFTRERGMPFADALRFLLDMRKSSIQTRLNQYYKKVKGGDAISQQAFSKLRMNFDHSPFEKMVRLLVSKEYSGQYELPLWKGYHVFGIDGSSLQLPRADILRNEFGVRGRGGTCPCAGMSVLYDVLHGWAVDSILSRADMNERTECKKHIDFLCREMPNIAKNSIITMDRGYPSLELLENLQASGVKYLARCSSNFLSEINNTPMGDSTVVLKNDISVRIIKFVLTSGEIEILATNLFELSEALFPELYALRWGIETAYFCLKQELCIEKFSGKTPNSIRQDFWASMVLLNSVAVFQQEADAVVEQRQENKPIKHIYRARTSGLTVTLRDEFIFAVLSGNTAFTSLEMERIINTIAREVSAVRPNRAFPRNFKPAFKANHNLKSHLVALSCLHCFTKEGKELKIIKFSKIFKTFSICSCYK
jgi:sulfur transfer complex TusBCD TusB component (DsrH family)